jgi:hypothetical protein
MFENKTANHAANPFNLEGIDAEITVASGGKKNHYDRPSI